jgi:hypothetical protein
MPTQVFDGSDSVRDFLMDFWRNLDQSTLMSVDCDWIERLQKVIAVHGEHASKSVTKIKFQ